MKKRKKKNEQDIPNPETTKRVFQQLDECVEKARNAKKSGDWTEAQREAEKLQRMISFVRSAEAAAHSVAAMAGVCHHDWLLVTVSTLTALGILVVLYASRQKK